MRSSISSINIWYCFFRDTLKLKLIDFGCAVKVDENRKEKLGGTTEYMAPEVNTYFHLKHSNGGLGIVIK